MLKINWGSRVGYSIEDKLLEKRMACNYSAHNRKVRVNNNADVEAHYDYKLVRIGIMALESAGENRKSIKLISSVLTKFKNFMRVSYGASKKNMVVKQKIGRRVEENKTSAIMWRDPSCLILNYVEQIKIGIENKYPIRDLNE